MGIPVQFWGKENVITAYEYAGMPNWAIFAQRNLLTAFEGASVAEGSQSLDQFFDMLAGSQSDGIYQLRMYKNPKGDITNSTAYNASFNFRLKDQDPDERIGGSSHLLRALNDRLDKIEGQLTDDQDDDLEPAGWQATLGAVLAKPEFQSLILEKIVGLVRGIFGPKGSPPAAGATVGSVPEEETLPDAGILYNALPDDQKLNMDAAIRILMAKDPQVGTNLLKIATILQTNPDRYRMFAQML